MQDEGSGGFVQAVSILLMQNRKPISEIEDLRDTPRRVWMAFEELLAGHGAQKKIDAALETTFSTTHAEMVSVLGIRASGVCPHHLLPVLYAVDFGYIPTERAIGLSKIPRVVKWKCARAMLQEDITSDIADTFSKALTAKGVAVIVHGFHTCMAIRGVQAREATMVTSAMRGVFLENDKDAKSEFMQLRRNGGMPWT